MTSFSYAANPVRVVFGRGTLDVLADEVLRLGRDSALLISAPRFARRATAALGTLIAAEFGEAAMHTPVEVTERALKVVADHDIDVVVAVGGGSATGLAKAIALRTDLPQVVVPTTYAGSEMTPVLGETSAGRKTTQSSPKILPEVVLYDVDLTLGLPVRTSAASGVNALAHAVEALYSPDVNPMIEQAALEAIRLLAWALPRIAAEPSDVDARTDALRAAWLAGTCLGSAGMGLHHKLCHALGGSFGLPHAETHTVVLPYAMAYNALAVPDVMRRIADALGAPDAATGVYDLVRTLPVPHSLSQLGLSESDLPRAAEIATSAPYPNPRTVSHEGLTALLHDAWHGDRPISVPPDVLALTEQTAGSFATAPDPRVRELLTDLVRTLHGYVVRNDVTQAEWEYAIGFLTRTGQISSA
ncbi:MAG TPA: maleylacetate reductase and hydroxyquinol 1,2-dioxygenase domain-containing protein, partial [Amycolatopsis sp.]|nr:maleylacetate reductase and hydroxyquinol 1,2-dioxygenase domain-containing protein [Amycolatopsis sp.]